MLLALAVALWEAPKFTVPWRRFPSKPVLEEAKEHGGAVFPEHLARFLPGREAESWRPVWAVATDKSPPQPVKGVRARNASCWPIYTPQLARP